MTCYGLTFKEIDSNLSSGVEEKREIDKGKAALTQSGDWAEGGDPMMSTSDNGEQGTDKGR